MFKVGQVVWCTTNKQYVQTDYHVKCIVVSARPGYITVRIAEGRYIGNVWEVETIFFEPVQNHAKII